MEEVREEWHCCFCAKCRLDQDCKDHVCQKGGDCHGCESCVDNVLDCDGYDEDSEESTEEV